MEKKSREEELGHRVESSVKGRQFIRVEIRHIPTPDAEWRLRRAIDILLSAAATERKGNANAREEEPLND